MILAVVHFSTPFRQLAVYPQRSIAHGMALCNWGSKFGFREMAYHITTPPYVPKFNSFALSLLGAPSLF